MTTLASRLESTIKKTVEEKSTSESVANGRQVQNNVRRFAECVTNEGHNLTIPVTVETNLPHTSKGVKRKRCAKENAEKSSVGFAKITNSKRK